MGIGLPIGFRTGRSPCRSPVLLQASIPYQPPSVVRLACTLLVTPGRIGLRGMGHGRLASLVFGPLRAGQCQTGQRGRALRGASGAEVRGATHGASRTRGKVAHRVPRGEPASQRGEVLSLVAKWPFRGANNVTISLTLCHNAPSRHTAPWHNGTPRIAVPSGERGDDNGAKW